MKPQTVSGHGLTPRDHKLLARTLAELEVVMEVPHMLGHHDADKGFAIKRRLNNRLTPEEPSKLIEDARSFIDLFSQQIERARAEVRAREQEHEAYVAERAAKRAARSTDLAAKLEALDQKRRAQIEAWRKENG